MKVDRVVVDKETVELQRQRFVEEVKLISEHFSLARELVAEMGLGDCDYSQIQMQVLVDEAEIQAQVQALYRLIDWN